MADDPKKPVAAIKTFFGFRREGDTLTDFMAELKELTPEDKEQLASGINDRTLTY